MLPLSFTLTAPNFIQICEQFCTLESAFFGIFPEYLQSYTIYLLNVYTNS